MLYVIVGVGALLLGMFLGLIFVLGTTYSGTFVINETNPDKDIYRIEFDKLSDVHDKTFVMFRVKKDS